MQTFPSPPALFPEIVSIRKKQQAFFAAGKTKDLAFRREMLQKLETAIIRHEQNLIDALYADLRRNAFDAYGLEIGLTLSELRKHIQKLAKWAKPRRVPTPLFHFKATCYLHPEPYGSVLLISPWNFPVLLTLQPLIGAISAGNTIVIKPSEMSVHTTKVIKQLISEIFPEEYIAVVEGGIEPTQALLSEKWDYIFFTGSVPVGKIVYQAAAKHLTPVTLELGGKSPAIIDETVNIEKGIKRLLWGKFVNCGQTCVAPDYILVQESIKDKVITRMKALLQEFYGTDISNHPVYGRIINDRHFQRLAYLLKDEKILLGGEMRAEEKFISPTLVEVTNLDSPLMQDEIFGPILPIISYKTLEEAIAIVHSHPKPLALYVFSENQKNIKQILESTSFGGGCVNETLMHLGTHHLPFGGVGDSGIGSYHGKYTFETFSHLKSIMYKATWMDLPVRYPHQQLPLSWLKRLQRWTI